ncbi:DUF4105 domain-containing protein [Bdellovibrio sp. HCB290]|uniref:lipoprotein N-acyltransferase Lnb domain-containing protein n=1 Tax=Bdellovibrio sp. HCB290 TaxID=3394356 RepID=UPI0039B4811B
MKMLSSLLKIFICGFGLFVFAPVAQASGAPDLRDVKKIYYLVAAGKGLGQSAFGHSYLRLGFHGKPHPNDLVLELVADVSSKINILKGLGIGENYTRVAVLESFISVQYEMNIRQNRDLQSTEIILSNAQRSLILQRIMTLVSQRKMGEYSFLRKNCAEGIAVILSNLNLDSNLLDSPNNVLARLKAKGFVGPSYNDLGLANKNLEIVVKYSSVLDKIEKAVPEFKKALFGGGAAEQILGFVLVKNNINQLPSSDQVIALRFLKSMAYLQPRLTQIELMEFVNGKRNLQVVNLGTSSILADYGEGFSIRDWSFHAKGDGVVAKVRIDSAGATRKDKYNRTELHLSSSQLTVVGSELLFNNQPIGILVSDNVAAGDHGVVFKNAIAVPVLYERDRRATTQNLGMFLVVDEQMLSAVTDVAQNNIIPLLNDDPAQPSCYGFVDFQKGLFERAKFLPEAAPLTSAQYLVLIQDLLFQQKLVYFPGVRNASELIQLATPAAVRSLIYEYHVKTYSSMSSAIATYFKSNRVSEVKDMESLRLLGENGLNFTIYFRVHMNGKKTNIGHALLVKSMKRIGSRYYLNAYDPNLGAMSSDLFYLDTATGKLHTTLYGVTEMQVIPADFEMSLTTSKLQQGSVEQLLKSYVGQSNIYSLGILEVLMMH